MLSSDTIFLRETFALLKDRRIDKSTLISISVMLKSNVFQYLRAFIFIVDSCKCHRFFKVVYAIIKFKKLILVKMFQKIIVL